MSDLQERMDQLRLAILETVDQLLAKSTECRLNSPPDSMAVCRERLARNTYQILVVGEVKRGKSSFINALIGKEILPMNVEVATSQVFRVSRGEREAYRLRFEDGSTLEILRDDLASYGSQVVADEQGVPSLDKFIRWIEIEVPVRFLPPGVSMLDTPGLGGLYEFHAEITHRFIPEADAVVFVLDSTRPIIEEELKYLEKILHATRNVFFVQTKIDLFRGKQWQEIHQRNQEILGERFHDRLLDTAVWPISCRLLSMAAAEEDPDFEIASRHRELAPALKSFLFRAAGWTRAAEILILATEYQSQGARILEDRHKALISETKQERDEFQRQLTQRKDHFLGEWGDRGQRRRELRDELRKVATLGKAQISQFLSRGGELESSLLNAVEATDSIESLAALSERIASDAGARAMKAWREVSERSWNRFMELLAPFLRDLDDVTAPNRKLPGGELATTGAVPQIARDWYAKIKNTRFDFGTGLWAGGLTAGAVSFGVVGVSSLSVVLGAVLMPVVIPIAAVAGFITAAWIMIRGNKTANLNHLNAQKQAVSRNVTEVCHKTRQHYLDVNLSTGTFGPIDEYFSKLEKIAEDQIERLTKKKTAETEEEIARLKREAELSQIERKAEAEQVRLQMTAWMQMRQGLNELGLKLNMIDQEAGNSRNAAEAREKPGGAAV